MPKISIYVKLLFFYLLFLAVAFLSPQGAVLPDWLDKVSSVSTFIFAIILAFSTANRKDRLNSIRALLRQNDALMLVIYEAAKCYGGKAASEVRSIMDSWLIRQIDYFLIDFDKTDKELKQLVGHCFNMKVAKDEDEEPKKIMVDCCRSLLNNQKAIVYWLKDGMRFFEWFSLSILGSIILFSLYSVKTDSVIYLLAVPLVSTSLVLLFLVLKELDNLSWQEDRWIWNRLTELFTDLDLLPYYPNDIFEKNRVKKEVLALPPQYRLAIYKDPYPDVSHKEVLVVSDPQASREEIAV